MAEFERPVDLTFNRVLVGEPDALARETNAASWLFLCGGEFASMDGGVSYASVQAAVHESAQVVSDRPWVVDMELARRGRECPFAGFDELRAWVVQGLDELG